MIILDDVTIGGGLYEDSPQILARSSIILPSDRRIALLGPSEAAKQTLIKVLAGAAMPTGGHIIRRAEVSFPVGQLPGFSRKLSVRLNIAHVARLYGADVRRTIHIVETSLNLRQLLDKPYERLPKKLRRPLAQAVAFAIPFDVYLMTNDRIRPPAARQGGKNLAGECYALFAARARTSGMIIPTNNQTFINEHCDMAVCLDAGRLEIVDPTNHPTVRLLRRRREPRRIA